MKTIFILVFVLFALSKFSNAQELNTPLENCSFKKGTTHDETQLFLKNIERTYKQIKIEEIGVSVQGRSISMVHILNEEAKNKIKVILFAQQHGNEPSGKEALLLLLKNIILKKDYPIISQMDLYIIPCLNPDGNENQKRSNANGEDLNRDHLLLSQIENISLHKAVRSIDPDVTLDIHEYSAFRKDFTSVGYVRSADEQFGAPTNLNVSPKIIDLALNQLFPFLDKELKSAGVVFSNYFKMNTPADTVRASTTSIDDGRQSFAIQNTFSLILEGKNGRNFNDELKRRSLNQLFAIEKFLQFVNMNSSKIIKIVKSEQKKIGYAKDNIAVVMDYSFEGAKINLPMKTFPIGKDTLVQMKYSPAVKILETVNRPMGYIIPKNLLEVINFLDRHSIKYIRISQPQEKKVEIYTVVDISEVNLENKFFTDVKLNKSVSKIKLWPGDVLVNLSNRDALKVIIALEPNSMWGLSQYVEFNNLLNKGSDYPIFRIPAKGDQ